MPRRKNAGVRKSHPRAWRRRDNKNRAVFVDGTPPPRRGLTPPSVPSSSAVVSWPQPASMSIPRRTRGVALILNSSCKVRQVPNVSTLDDFFPEKPLVGFKGSR